MPYKMNKTDTVMVNVEYLRQLDSVVKRMYERGVDGWITIFPKRPREAYPAAFEEVSEPPKEEWIDATGEVMSRLFFPSGVYEIRDGHVWRRK